ncbi:TIGR03767 family metallophosphoesterase [Nocardioides sp. SYSU D00038]|uniref:TIGR03767 family metallophosphoesterase n=1 Tax=Nocardioides sp. SYSU D00038 TaxID=2812554 RepID=UPI00196898A6|nr:TIGR03767 family metallophosphoesterase [Nocardioides sp. SYSU D00038]
MKLTRRGLIRSGAALGGVAAASSLPAAPTRAAGVRAAAGRTLAALQRTTLVQVLLRGTPDALGYRKVVTGPGEPHLLRTDLGVAAVEGRVARRRPLIAFAQLSDVHITDVQSPLRVEWTDRLEDPPSPLHTGLLTSAYRPQELMCGQVADAMVRELNEIGSGPVTGLPLTLAIQTGDNSDNSQFNEVRWNIDLLDGGTVKVDSGNPNKFEGVADDNPLFYDQHYWHPHGTPRGKIDDVPRRKRGFPTVPGLLDAVRRPFQAQGLQMEWYSAFGNHDGLAQGNFPQSLQLGLVSTGILKIVSPPAGLAPGQVLEAFQDGDPVALLQSLALTPAVRVVTPDARRKLLTRKQVVEQHFQTTGLPVGHGFTPENRTKGTAYYFFDKGDVRFVVLDTVNPNGYSDGSIDNVQFQWLQQLLAASTDKIVLVFSHHTSGTMTNPLQLTGLDGRPRVLGGRVVEELLEHPHVAAWINGHTHRNQIWARTRADGTGGFWEINTASHIDWPQQSRLIEIADNQDGTLSIFTTLVDHAGPPAASGTGDSLQLAALGRELAANDWHHADDSHRGNRDSRNVELVVQAPAFLAARAASAPAVEAGVGALGVLARG